MSHTSTIFPPGSWSREALALGSYLVMTHATNDYLTEQERAESDEANRRSGVPFQLR